MRLKKLSGPAGTTHSALEVLEPRWLLSAAAPTHDVGSAAATGATADVPAAITAAPEPLPFSKRFDIVGAGDVAVDAAGNTFVSAYEGINLRTGSRLLLSKHAPDG